MLITFEKTLTPEALLSQLADSLGVLQELGINEVAQASINFELRSCGRPVSVRAKDGTPVTELGYSAEEFSKDRTATQQGRATGLGDRFELVDAPEPAACGPAPDGGSFAGIFKRHRLRAEIFSEQAGLTDIDDPDVLLTRFIRIAVLTSHEAERGDVARLIDSFDGPREELGGRSLWQAALDDEGCIAWAAARIMENVPDLKPRRLKVFKQFRSLWFMPELTIEAELRLTIFNVHRRLWGTNLAAAYAIACKPSLVRPSKTLYELVTSAKDPIPVMESELERLVFSASIMSYMNFGQD
jgi:hypothetical protein